LSHYGDHLCQVISKTFQGLKSYGADTKVLQTDELTDGGHSYNPLTATRKVLNNVGLVPSEKAIHIKAQNLFIYFWKYLKTNALSVLFLTSVTEIYNNPICAKNNNKKKFLSNRHINTLKGFVATFLLY
jgi:hypothetical protein